MRLSLPAGTSSAKGEVKQKSAAAQSEDANATAETTVANSLDGQPLFSFECPK